MTTADAYQAYEACRTEWVLPAFDEILAGADVVGDEPASVVPRFVEGLNSHVHVAQSGCQNHALGQPTYSTWRNFAAASVQPSCSPLRRSGRLVQMRGVPIGGLASRPALSAVLGAVELRWLRPPSAWRREWSLRMLALRPRQALAAVRYVDDV